MNPQENTALARIGQIAINAHDVDRATAFYRDVLGLRHLFRVGQLSFFDCGGVRLMLDKAEKRNSTTPAPSLYFQVSDIHTADGRLRDAGAKFEDEPHVNAQMPKYDLWMTFFRDSENNLLALMSECRACPKSIPVQNFALSAATSLAWITVSFSQYA